MGEYLAEAVDSVLSQTYSDFEIIIVDDASTDMATRQLLECYSHPKIHVIHNLHNMGVAAARNEGIRAATGEFILPLDADDVIGDTYLEKAMGLFVERQDVGIVYCDAEFFGEKEGYWELPDFSLKQILSENIIFSAAFYRKSDWQCSGGYCPLMKAGWEDWDFWLSLVSLGAKVVKIPETLFKYRIRDDSRDRSIPPSTKVLLLLRILYRHRQLYWLHPFSLIQVFTGIGKRYYGS